jgi:alpha-amylase/alpha-mannosidase (GH57 family)
MEGIPMSKHIAVHLHEYQPDRRNPLTGLIEDEFSAIQEAVRIGKRARNWTEVIAQKSYRPVANASVNIGDATGAVNLYQFVSFNFGATLLDWMRDNAPDLLHEIISGDRFSIWRTGHGNAIAQLYNHAIAPLLHDNDKEVQIVWGIENFRHYFGRAPEGMWLAECAVDRASLKALKKAGIKFTILSQHQAWKFRESGAENWVECNSGIDPSRPYRYDLGDGESIVIFFYDKEISQAVAYEKLTKLGGPAYLNRLKGGFAGGRSHDQLVSVCTDGETYGHHVEFGEKCLAWVVRELMLDKDIELTNYGAFLESHPAAPWVMLHEPSAWSCAHGVGRWERDCGCNDADISRHQRWRGPLRRAISMLRKEMDKLVERHGPPLFTCSPHEALLKYIHVLLGESTTENFLKEVTHPNLSAAQTAQALDLMEIQRLMNLAMTSCGWYFDELSRPEPVQNLICAADAMRIASVVDPAVQLEEAFLQILQEAECNLNVRVFDASGPDRIANGRDVWEGLVLRHFPERTIVLKKVA